jgi:Fe-S-cluster containining protein
MSDAEGDSANVILKKIDDWACVKNCGACCKLGPLDSRPDLESYLTRTALHHSSISNITLILSYHPAEDLKLYKSMIGPDDWCVHFDQSNRMCKIYDERPQFCRVELTRFIKMFDIEPEEFTVIRLLLLFSSAATA